MLTDVPRVHQNEYQFIVDRIKRRYDLKQLSVLVERASEKCPHLQEYCNIEERLEAFLEFIYYPLGIHTEGLTVLDIGSGLCLNQMICQAMNGTCTSVDRIEDSPDVELYLKFQNTTGATMLPLNITPSTFHTQAITTLYDLVVIVSQSFDERGSEVWSLAEWQQLLTGIGRHLTSTGKIVLIPNFKDYLGPVIQRQVKQTMKSLSRDIRLRVCSGNWGNSLAGSR